MAEPTLSISVAFDGDAKSIKGLVKSVNGLKKAFEGTFAPLEKSRRSFGGYRGALDSVTRGMLKLNQTVDGLQNAMSGLDAIFSSGLSLDTSITDLSALTGVAGEGLAEIESSARNLAKTFGGSAADVVESYKLILSQLGPDIAGTPEALADMGRSVTVLSKTMGGDTVSAAQVLTTAMNQFGVSMDDPVVAAGEMSRMMNVMAAAAQAGSAELPAIKEALEQCGMAAASANVSFEETNAAIQVLDARGRKASEGGVALRNVLATLSQGRFLPAATLAELEKAGVDVAALADTTRSLAGRLELLTPLLDDTALLAKLFGKENQNAAMALIGSTDKLREYTEAVTGTASAEEQAGVVMGSTAERMARMQARVDDLKISLMQMAGGMYPVTKAALEIAVPVSQTIPLFTSLTGALRKAVPAVKGFIASVARVPSVLKAAVTGTAAYRTALAGLTTALGSARVATVALGAAMSLGVTAVITGLTALISRLVKKHREQKEAADEAAAAMEGYKDTLSRARAELSGQALQVQEFTGSKDAEQAKLDELNASYGDVFGTYDTLSEWYDVLSGKSEDYARLMANETRIREQQERVAAAQTEAESIRARMDQTPQTVDRVLGFIPTVAPKPNRDYTDLEESLAEQQRIIEEGNKAIAAAVEENKAIRASLKVTSEATTGTGQAIDAETAQVRSALDRMAETFTRIEARNAIFGQSQNDLKDKIAAVRSEIEGIVSAGTTEGAVLDALIAKYRELLALRAQAGTGDILDNSAAGNVALPAQVESPALTAALSPGISWDSIRDQRDKETLKWLEEYSDRVSTLSGNLYYAQDALSMMGSAMSNMSGLVGEGAAQWLSYGANVLQTGAQLVDVVMQMIAASAARVTANKAEELSEKSKANAQMMSAVTGAMSSQAGIPIVGPILAVAAVASLVAALASIPKFAKGGIAYGPTLGMFGEYAGAANNPEVVAPLDKLRGMLAPPDDGPQQVTFRIEGRDLVGTLNKRNNLVGRTR